MGEAGIYVTNPTAQPTAVVAFAGLWDAVAATWDALENGDPDRYAFAAYSDGTNPETLRVTLRPCSPADRVRPGPQRAEDPEKRFAR